MLSKAIREVINNKNSDIIKQTTYAHSRHMYICDKCVCVLVCFGLPAIGNQGWWQARNYSRLSLQMMYSGDLGLLI